MNCVRLLLLVSFVMGINLHAALLTEDGKPSAIILLWTKPSDCAKKGASELQEFVKAMSGAELPVATVFSKEEISKYSEKWRSVILLGESSQTEELGLSIKDLKPDGYRILVKDNIVAVVGNDSVYYDQVASRTPVKAGTLYGVYGLLEQLGVRFYQQDNTIIPHAKTIELKNMELTVNPYFPYRINESMTDPWFRRIGYGGDRDPWASRHSFFNWTSRFKNTNPGYFCFDKNGSPDFYNLGFTHEGVIEQMANDAKSHFSQKKLPDGRRKYFMVLPNDYFMQMCSCEKCQALVDQTRPKNGWYSDYVADAVVKVADAVKKDFPDCYIVYGAYERYQLPPTRIKKLPDNVVVMIASLTRSKRPIWMESGDRELLEGWQKLQPAAIYFWRYSTYGEKGVPWVMPHLISESIKTMKEFSEKGKTPVLGEMHFYRWDKTSRWWQNLNDYVYGKMLWNPDINCETLLSEYYHDFYGPAAEYIKKFFSLLENNYMTYSDSDYIPPETAFELNALLDKAAEGAGKQEYADRINYIKENFIALRKCVKIYQEERSGKTTPINIKDIAWKMSNEEDKKLVNQHAVREDDGFRFNGKDSCLQLFPPVVIGDEYTLEAWIRPDKLEIRPVLYGESFNAYEPYYIFGSDIEDPTYNSVGFSVVGKCLMFNDKNLCIVKSKPLELNEGQWYHVMAVADKKNSELSIYLDGKLVGIQTILNKKTPKSKLTIKSIGAGGGGHGLFSGIIKDACIYNTALSVPKIMEKTKGKNND